MSYAEFVKSRTKPMNDVDHANHAFLGQLTELGELADAWKKHWVYEKDLDRVNVIEELGDLCFYIQMGSDFDIEEFAESADVILWPITSCFKDFLRAMLADDYYDMVMIVLSIAKKFDLTIEEILAANVEKLTRRYPTTYTNKDAIERKDKA